MGPVGVLILVDHQVLEAPVVGCTHNIVVLEGVAAYLNPARKEKRAIHAVGDGTFIVDGRKIDRRKMMASKLPPDLAS